MQPDVEGKKEVRVEPRSEERPVEAVEELAVGPEHETGRPGEVEPSAVDKAGPETRPVVLAAPVTEPERVELTIEMPVEQPQTTYEVWRAFTSLSLLLSFCRFFQHERKANSAKVG